MLRYAVILALSFLSAVGAWAQKDSDSTHPSFLIAAVFFISAHEPPELTMLSDTAIRDGDTDYEVSDNDKCTVLVKQTVSPYDISRYEFRKLPSPSTIRYLGGNAALMPGIPNDTICHAKRGFDADGQHMHIVDGSTLCDTSIMFGGHLISRRVNALWYIRSNFCAGLPEPERPPY